MSVLRRVTGMVVLTLASLSAEPAAHAEHLIASVSNHRVAVTPIPAFAPNEFKLEITGGWLGFTMPDVQLYPNQRQTGVQILPVPDGTCWESQVLRKYQPPPPIR